jgi:phage terminase Nu1 subunit (DNA packaging protein)
MIEQIIDTYIFKQKVYVNTKFLCAYFNRTDKQIGRWKKDGLPVFKKPKELNKRGDFYNLEEVIKWVDENVNKIKASNSKKTDDEIDLEDEEKLFEMYTNGTAQQKRKILLTLSQNRLDNFRKIEDIIAKEGANKELDSKYALVDKVKKGEQELASIFISLLKNSMPVLSKKLENKKQDEIYHELDRHFKKEINKIIKYIKTDEEVIVALVEIIDAIIQAVTEKNVAHEKILKLIRGLK